MTPHDDGTTMKRVKDGDCCNYFLTQQRQQERDPNIHSEVKSARRQQQHYNLSISLMTVMAFVLSCNPANYVSSFVVSSPVLSATTLATRTRRSRTTERRSQFRLQQPPTFKSSASTSTSSSKLDMSGRGVANNYTWREEAFEIEVTVTVPKTTKAKDITFKATSTSISLTMDRNKTKKKGKDLKNKDNQSESENENESLVLLDPNRKLRGRVVVDGTYWEISDDNPDISIHDKDKDLGSAPGDGDDDNLLLMNVIPKKYVTVTIEKFIRTPKNDMDVIDYDWYGVYSTENENEVTYRKYDEPEKLNVREYAKTLGVDIDNINMSLVDKTMFTSGLGNTTKQTEIIDNLKETGYIQQDDIIEQNDGTQWVTNEHGEPIPYNGTAATGTATAQGGGDGSDDANQGTTRRKETKIPFLDTESPWNKNTISVDEIKQNMQKQKEKFEEEQSLLEDDDDDEDDQPSDDGEDFLSPFFDSDDDDTKKKTQKATWEQTQPEEVQSISSKPSTPRRPPTTTSKTESTNNGRNDVQDPIGTLTVARLKDILRAQGLKVGGNKKELQERLRNHVQNMLHQKEDNNGANGK